MSDQNMSTSEKEHRLKNVACLASLIYTGQDFHKLSENEKALVNELEKLGRLTPSSQGVGFVGRVIPEYGGEEDARL